MKSSWLVVLIIIIVYSNYTLAGIIQLTKTKEERLKELQIEYSQYPFLIDDLIGRWDPKVNFALIKEYDQVISLIRPGDTVIIGNTEYKIINFLGGDSASFIFEIPGDKVLRIAQHSNGYSVMKAYLEQYVEYSKHGVQIVKTYLQESNNYGIISDKIQHLVTMWGFLRQLKNKKIEDYTELEKKMLKGIKDFEVSIAIYDSMDDVHLEQIGFDRKTMKWILFDWCNKPTKILSSDAKLFLTDGYIKFNFPEIITDKFYSEIKLAVVEKRNEILFSKSCIKYYRVF